MNKDDLTQPEKLSEEIIDFVYQNGVAFLEATRVSNKSIANKSLLLLSYLVVAIGFCTNHLVGFLKVDVYDQWDVIAIIGFGIILIYYALIGLWVIYIAKPREIEIGYNIPSYLLSKEYLDIEKYKLTSEEYLKHMKYYSCLHIDESIKINLININKRMENFENALACALILPMIWKLLKKVSCSF